MIRQSGGEIFESMLERYSKLIWKKAHSYYLTFQGGIVSLDDLYQEGVIGFNAAIYSYIESYNVGLAHYISLCVETSIRSFARKCRSRAHALLDNRLSLDMCINEEAQTLFSEIVADPSKNKDPRFMAYFRETQEIVEKVLATCHEKEAKVYKLRQSGYTYDEIATQLSIPHKSIDNCIQKIRRKIASYL